MIYSPYSADFREQEMEPVRGTVYGICNLEDGTNLRVTEAAWNASGRNLKKFVIATQKKHNQNVKFFDMVRQIVMRNKAGRVVEVKTSVLAQYTMPKPKDA